MAVAERPVGHITPKQIAMLIARLNALGARNEQERFDWLLTHAGVNVDSYKDITPQQFQHDIIPTLVEAENKKGY